MKSKDYLAIGVMSGTSLDGIDLAAVKFTVTGNCWAYQFIEAKTYPYTAQWVEKLSTAVRQTGDLFTLNKEYTAYLASVILQFIEEFSLQEIQLVCSHGHTIFHQPKKKFTLQIGNLPVLAKLLNSKVICDFRIEDVELGGQGAPLVPIGDQLLFSEYDYCLNLGGFANLSTTKDNERIAYDICAVNTVLNKYASDLGLLYDDGGNIAKKGKVHTKTLHKLNKLPFYGQQIPKSLGIEWVNMKVFPLLKKPKLSPEDSMATYTVHVAHQIAKCFENSSSQKILVTGGGAYNKYLISCIQQETQAEIVIPNKTIVEYKEALVFALLGVLKLRGEVNVLKSVTGASENHSSGKVFTP